MGFKITLGGKGFGPVEVDSDETIDKVSLEEGVSMSQEELRENKKYAVVLKGGGAGVYSYVEEMKTTLTNLGYDVIVVANQEEYNAMRTTFQGEKELHGLIVAGHCNKKKGFKLEYGPYVDQLFIKNLPGDINLPQEGLDLLILSGCNSEEALGETLVATPKLLTEDAFVQTRAGYSNFVFTNDEFENIARNEGRGAANRYIIEKRVFNASFIVLVSWWYLPIARGKGKFH